MDSNAILALGGFGSGKRWSVKVPSLETVKYYPLPTILCRLVFEALLHVMYFIPSWSLSIEILGDLKQD